MRQVIVMLAVAAALAVPAGAQGTTTVEVFNFDETFLLCNGDPIHVSGPLLSVETITVTPSGGEILSFHFQPQGITGVDLITGTVFHATGLTRDLTVFSPPGGITDTFVNRFHIQATAGDESYVVSEVFHVTVAPDGTVRSFFDNSSATC